MLVMSGCPKCSKNNVKFLGYLDDEEGYGYGCTSAAVYQCNKCKHYWSPLMGMSLTRDKLVEAGLIILKKPKPFQYGRL